MNDENGRKRKGALPQMQGKLFLAKVLWVFLFSVEFIVHNQIQFAYVKGKSNENIPRLNFQGLRMQLPH